MSFPTELPQNSLAVILNAVSGKPTDAGHIVLAGYDLLGYGLYCGFGDVKYLMGAIDMSKLSKLIELLQNLDMSKLPHYAEIAAFILELVTAKYSWPMIALQAILKFGPSVLPMLKQLYDVYTQLRS